MSEKNTGGPAFPLAELDQATPNLCAQHMGMTLRDYFAAKALPIAWAAYDKGYCKYDFGEVTVSIAEHAYQFADAMLKAREL